MESSGFMDVKTLTATGIYTIVIDPETAATGNLTLTLSDVPADVTGSRTIGDAAVSVSIAMAGQGAALTFAGTAGQQATVRMTGNTIGYTTVRLLKPDGCP